MSLLYLIFFNCIKINYIKTPRNCDNRFQDIKMQQINRNFLATVNDTGIVIVGDPQTIQVDENGS